MQPATAQMRRKRPSAYPSAPVKVLLAAVLTLSPFIDAQQSSSSSAPSDIAKNPQTASSAAKPKKLVLKDGSYQLVREYQVEGDRVRYWDVDSSQWQEIPADLVDWAATKKDEADENQREATLLASVHKRQEESQAQVLDIDASIEVIPGVFLPPGEGIFVFDGRAVLPLAQAESSSSLSKGKLLEKVIVPVPITPTRHIISLKGEHANLQIHSGQPEFYVRATKPGMPQMDLFRVKIRDGNREVEHLDEVLGEQELSGKTIAMQPWQIAEGVYRYTPVQETPPGEYALVQVVSAEPISILVWDFGIGRGAGPATHVNP
jgi:hypothetical protein